MFHGLGKKFINKPIGEDNVAGNAIRFDQIEEGGVGTAPAPAVGMQRFPTEPPPSRADDTTRSRGWNWSGSAMGFLAGIAAMAMWRRRRS
jgi:hypothetical protein